MKEKIQVSFTITEMFYSVQGEGINIGKPAMFIRFSGCNLNCSFCDTIHETNFTLKLDNLIDSILNSMYRYNCKLLVLTGGEPTLQDIDLLINALHDIDNKLQICIETNGTNVINVKNIFVTCSPKFPKFEINCIPNELKFIIDMNISDKKIYDIINRQYNSENYNILNIPIFLQPNGNDFRTIKIAHKYANYLVQYFPNLRLGIQMQKYYNLR